MIQYVVYKNPLDYPGQFVARRWVIQGPPEYGIKPDPQPLAVRATLGEVRAAIHWLDGRDLVRIPRSPTDDPAILEVWL